MSYGLQVTNQKGLTSIQNEVIAAGAAVRILEAEPEDTALIIRGLVKTTVAESGYNMEPKDIEALEIGVLGDIYRDFRALTCDEVSLCFRMGVRGKFGPFHGLSIISFYKWLESFVVWKAAQVNEIKSKLPQLAAPVFTQEQKEKTRKEFIESIVEQYRRYCKNPEAPIFDAGNIIYKTLNDFELISITKDRKKELIGTAKNNLTQAKKREGNISTVEFKEASAKFNDAGWAEKIKERAKKQMIEIMRGDIKWEDEIFSEAMRLTLLEQYEFWAVTGEDVALLLFEKEKERIKNVQK